MPRKPAPVRKPKAPPKPKPAQMPDFSQHRLPEPFARLQQLGPDNFEAVYESISDALRSTGDVAANVQTLISMVLDLTYYDYDSDEDLDTADNDPRSWTRMHALRTLTLMGDAAAAGIEPLMALLDDEDDYVQEDASYYYGRMGEPAIEPLTGVLMDQDRDTYERAGAGSGLQEIAEGHPGLHDRVVALLEQALIAETEDDELAGYLVINLMEVGAKESVSVIAQAFKEERIDRMVVQMADVEEHFGLPITAPRAVWKYLPEHVDGGGWSDDPMLHEELEMPRLVTTRGSDSDTPAVDTLSYEESEEVAIPYVAAIKAGRNDPCPCGSGKKYKKCCGA